MVEIYKKPVDSHGHSPWHFKVQAPLDALRAIFQSTRRNPVLCPSDIDRSQSYFWTKEWQEAEKEASEDIRAGRVKTFDTAEELIEDLG